MFVFGVKMKNNLVGLKKLWRYCCAFFDSKVGDFLFLATIITTYAGMSLSSINRYAFTFDEAFSAYVIRFSFADIAKLTAFDVHSPLYYWLLKIWSSLFGVSELALRSMSTFFACLVIMSMYFLIKLIYERKTARWVAFVLMFSPMLFWYSQEARMYSLMAFVAVVSTYLIVLATQNEKVKLPWVLYGIVSGIGILVQYMFVLVLMSHIVWRFFDIKLLKNKKEFFSDNFILSYLCVFLVVLLWIPFIFSQTLLIQTGGFWAESFGISQILDFFTSTIVAHATEYMSLFSWVFFIIAIISIVRLFSRFRLVDRGDSSKILLICMAIIPVIVLSIISIPPLRSVFIQRYLISSSVFVYVLVAIAISKIRNKGFVDYIAVAVILLITFSSFYFIDSSNVPKNMGMKDTKSRDIVNMINELPNRDTKIPIVVSHYSIFYGIYYYSHDIADTYFIERSGDDVYGSFAPLKSDPFASIDINSNDLDIESFWYVEPLHDNSIDKSTPSNLKWRTIRTLVKNTGVNKGIRATLYEVVKL